MESGYDHKVLVVDADPHVGKTLCHILEKENLQALHDVSGESALKRIKASSLPFSLIIADQEMPDMKGSEFFEQVRTIHPDTIRFLLSRHSEMQTVINAVNTGAVKRFIPKPWDNDKMGRAIRWGIEHYERFLDNEKLFTLSKRQNTQLYELNCELMEDSKQHTRELMTLDHEIETIEARLKERDSQGKPIPSQIMDELEALLTPLGKPGQEVLQNLLSQTITLLAKEFREMALKNGFELPEPPGEGLND